MRVAAQPIPVPLLLTHAFVYYRPTFIQEVGVKSTHETFLAMGLIQMAGVIAEIVSFLLIDR